MHASLRGCWLALCMVSLVGCATVREEIKPLADTTLIVTRAGDQMTLSWLGETGITYTIWHTARSDARTPWKVLPGAERMRGTGQQVTWRDRVPSGQARYYRLQAVPEAALRP